MKEHHDIVCSEATSKLELGSDSSQECGKGFLPELQLDEHKESAHVDNSSRESKDCNKNENISQEALRVSIHTEDLETRKFINVSIQAEHAELELGNDENGCDVSIQDESKVCGNKTNKPQPCVLNGEVMKGIRCLNVSI